MTVKSYFQIVELFGTNSFVHFFKASFACAYLKQSSYVHLIYNIKKSNKVRLLRAHLSISTISKMVIKWSKNAGKKDG
jgi:hypothetical protein